MNQTHVIDTIRAFQAGMPESEMTEPPEHKPEMLLMGCVDARLSILDIGIPRGKSLIYRNIAALVNGPDENGMVTNLSEAAALEFAINTMQVKDIVVMGHTDCGGIKACLSDNHDEHTQVIRDYLKPLESTREVIKLLDHSKEERARAMEQAAIRRSLERLIQYPFVQQAVEEGRIQAHGWIVDTATKELSEMDPQTGEFISMKTRCHSA